MCVVNSNCVWTSLDGEVLANIVKCRSFERNWTLKTTMQRLVWIRNCAFVSVEKCELGCSHWRELRNGKIPKVACCVAQRPLAELKREVCCVGMGAEQRSTQITTSLDVKYETILHCKSRNFLKNRNTNFSGFPLKLELTTKLRQCGRPVCVSSFIQEISVGCDSKPGEKREGTSPSFSWTRENFWKNLIEADFLGTKGPFGGVLAVIFFFFFFLCRRNGQCVVCSGWKFFTERTRKSERESFHPQNVFSFKWSQKEDVSSPTKKIVVTVVCLKQSHLQKKKSFRLMYAFVWP